MLTSAAASVFAFPASLAASVTFSGTAADGWSLGVGCTSDDDGKMEPWPSPYILMVDRGDCSFVQKVRNAQRSGAAGVIVADNTCLCSDTDCVSSNGEDVCETADLRPPRPTT